MIENPTNHGGKCNRCLIKEADFYCEYCESFNYFCSHCDGYIHSMPSKRDHNRKLLNKQNIPTIQEVKVMSPIRNNTILIDNNQPEPVLDLNNKFITDLRRYHDKEKKELLNEIDGLRHSYEDKAYNLQYQMEENNQTYLNNIQMLENEYNNNLRNIISVKEDEIIMLKKRNNDLERKVIEQQDQLEEYINTIQNQKCEFNARVSLLEVNLKECENELRDTLLQYEHKMKYMQDYNTQEKTKIINDYENNIDRMNKIYSENKDKYLRRIEQREKDISILLDQDKIDKQKHSKLIESLSDQIDKFKEDNKAILNSVKKCESEIRAKDESVLKLKEENSSFRNLVQELKVAFEGLKDEKEELQAKYEKAHKLIYGKIKR